MPYLQEPETGTAIRYARSDHAIPIPRPAADSASGVRSACAVCHTGRDEASLDAQVTAWYGTLKPRDDAITQVISGSEESDPGRAAGRLLLPLSPHTAAVFAGLARFADRHLSPDMPRLEGGAEERLRRLALHADHDVRALALAALHYARGDSPTVRRFLAAQLDSMGHAEPLLRTRWAVGLGYFMDKLGDGNPLAAVATYRKAAEIDHPTRVHLNLGIARRALRYADAVAAYQRTSPLMRCSWRGSAQDSACWRGDRAGAAPEYQRALSLNAHRR
jgi:hypothetical protein